MMPQSSEIENVARLAAGPEWDAAEVEPALAVLVSPSWRGVDSTIVRLRRPTDCKSCIVKVLHPEATVYVDVATSSKATKQASSNGIGAGVTSINESSGVIVMEDLSPEDQWATCTLEKLADRDIRAAVIGAHKSFQRTKPLGRAVSVFTHIEDLLKQCHESRVDLPPDIAWLSAAARELAEAIRACGSDTTPSHGDGNISNVMISHSGQVRLLDWDLAGDMDPFEDIGSLLQEAHDCEADAYESFEMYHGSFDLRVFNRAWLLGIIDHFRWGLIGLLMAATSDRVTYEFMKYAEWRLLRARMGIRDPRFSEKLERLG